VLEPATEVTEETGTVVVHGVAEGCGVIAVFAVLRPQRVLPALRAARLCLLHILHLPYNLSLLPTLPSPLLESSSSHLIPAIMADDNPVSAPAEAEKPETTSADKPEDKVPETVAASDEKTTGKKDSICVPRPPTELRSETPPYSG
jgi:hypothetical protein